MKAEIKIKIEKAWLGAKCFFGFHEYGLIGKVESKNFILRTFACCICSGRKSDWYDKPYNKDMLIQEDISDP